MSIQRSSPAVVTRLAALGLRAALILAVSPAAGAAQDRAARVEVNGLVVDASGAPVPGAVIRVDVGGSPAGETRTGADGRFAVAGVPIGEAVVRASAEGFAEGDARVSAKGELNLVRIVLQPAPLFETVTVTASRGAAQRLDTPAAASVLTSAELLNGAAGSIDDALRNTPGFSLFRRSSSRVANPTTQGVTLRGVSGSGASRTLVLADGLPLNDPFGSWVYWNRIPQAAIERVEVVRGAAGDLYGADALGGVIQVLTFAPGRPRLRAMVDAASHETARASVFGGAQTRGWSATVAGEWLETDGVPIVAQDDRGRADVAADSDYRTAFGAIGYDAGLWHAHARGSVYTEDRGNGTPLQVNDTDWRQFSGEAAGPSAGGAWMARVAGGTQDYFQTFSAVATGRRTERLTTAQRTPSTFTSVSGQWTRAWGSHAFLVGGEGKRTQSTVQEIRYSVAGVPSGPFVFGGTERGGSVFGRASLAASDRVTIGLGARGDFWKSEPRDATSATHSVGFLSPRASLTWRAVGGVSLHASAYRAFRTPTLNELHRGFRVGNVVTNPNGLLEPERLTGAEGGVLFARARVSARLTGFWNHLDRAISNITISATPALITRQRQNADQVRAAGVEVEADLRPHPRLTLNALAAFTASHFRHTPKQPALEGRRVPQVPSYQLGAGVRYAGPRTLTLSAQVRVLGAQFDDDLNQFELDEFAVVDVYAGHSIARGLQAFIAVENLFDTEYDVGRTPLRTIGWPRTVRGGVRMFLP